MYQVTVNEDDARSIALTEESIQIDNNELPWDMHILPDGSFSVILDGKSYTALLEEVDRDQKQIMLRIKGQVYTVRIEEPIDQLLKKMGLNANTTKKLEVIKAPMPGLILKILVEVGQEVKKGDPILVLEAMKMENVFKAPADATIKAIKTEIGKAVEKGEVLIELV